MGRHTEGRLLVDDGGSDCIGLFAKDAGAVCYLSAMAEAGYGLRGRETDEANAKRLAAAWNALLPFSTEQIENMDVQRLVEECREVLQELLEANIELYRECSFNYELSPRVQKTRALLAKLAPFEEERNGD